MITAWIAPYGQHGFRLNRANNLSLFARFSYHRKRSTLKKTSDIDSELIKNKWLNNHNNNHHYEQQHHFHCHLFLYLNISKTKICLGVVLSNKRPQLQKAVHVIFLLLRLTCFLNVPFSNRSCTLHSLSFMYSTFAFVHVRASISMQIYRCASSLLY